MLEQIRKQMLQNGYRQVQTSIPEVLTFCKCFQNIYYCVCVVDDRNSYLQGMGKMGYLMQCSKDLFTKSGHSCQVLGVIVTSNVALSRSRAQGAGWIWYADTVSGRLCVFDDQPGEFLDARRCLEDAITNVMAEGYWNYNEYSQEGYWKGDHSRYSYLSNDENQIRHRKTSLVRPFELTPVNTILIAINILVFLYQEIIGDTIDAYFLYENGGMAVYKILVDKNYSCLLTSAFMHAGIGHLFNNMFVLAYIGDNVERALGKWKYLVLYMISAIGANVLSFCWYYITNEYYIVSVGASGAVFGVIGALLYMVIKNKGRLEDMRSSQLVFFILLSLYYGFSSVAVNNIAHIGGLVIGVVVAFFLYHKNKKEAQSNYNTWSV